MRQDRPFGSREELGLLQRALEEKDRRITQLERALAGIDAPPNGQQDASPASPAPGTRNRTIVNSPETGAAIPAELKEELLAAHELLRKHTREKGIAVRPPKPAVARERKGFSLAVVIIASTFGALIGGGSTWYAASISLRTVVRVAPQATSLSATASTAPRGENASVYTGLPDPSLTPGETDTAPPGSHGSVPVEIYREVCRRYGYAPSNPRYGVARYIPDWMHGTNNPANLFATSRPLSYIKVQYDKLLKEMVDNWQISRARAEWEIRNNWVESWAAHRDKMQALESEGAGKKPAEQNKPSPN